LLKLSKRSLKRVRSLISVVKSLLRQSEGFAKTSEDVSRESESAASPGEGTGSEVGGWTDLRFAVSVREGAGAVAQASGRAFF